MGEQERSERREASASPGEAKTGGTLLVERLAHEGIPEICAMYKRVWESHRPELPPALVKAWVPTPLEFTSWMEGVTYFAARRDGRMIGAVGCEIADGSCRLLHLAVDPESRRQGVATALVAAALEWAKRNQCHSVWVEALARFSAAAELLRHEKFEESGVLHRHFLAEDVRLFERLL